MEIKLGTTKTCEFGEHIIIGLDKKFLKLNGGQPLEFDALIENEKLVLTSSLSGLVRANCSTFGEKG